MTITMKSDNFINSFPHRVISELFSGPARMNERTKWCNETFGHSGDNGWIESEVQCALLANNEPMAEYNDVSVRTQCFFFQNKDDAIMFKLVWGGYYAFKDTVVKV